MELSQAELWIKLALAIGCGAAIGLERELSDKPAGLRTNMLICVGSTLITSISIHLAIAYSERQVVLGDPGRIAGEMISGIGFLGAGAIIQARGSVHGLTTAATIWFMAGIGLAIGSGAYLWAIVTTIVLLVILAVVGWLEQHLSKPRRYAHFQVTARRAPGVIDKINALAEAGRLELDGLRLSRKDDRMSVTFASTMSPKTRDDLVHDLLEINEVEDVHVNA